MVIRITVLSFHPVAFQIVPDHDLKSASLGTCDDLTNLISGFVHDQGAIVKMIVTTEIEPCTCLADAIPENIPVLWIESEAVIVFHLKGGFMAERKNMRLLVLG